MRRRRVGRSEILLCQAIAHFPKVPKISTLSRLWCQHYFRFLLLDLRYLRIVCYTVDHWKKKHFCYSDCDCLSTSWSTSCNFFCLGFVWKESLYKYHSTTTLTSGKEGHFKGVSICFDAFFRGRGKFFKPYPSRILPFQPYPVVKNLPPVSLALFFGSEGSERGLKYGWRPWNFFGRPSISQGYTQPYPLTPRGLSDFIWCTLR